MNRRYIVTFQPEGLRADINEDESVLTASRRCGVQIESLCNGRGRCGKCLIRIDGGKATEATRFEVATLSEADIDRGIRLACQTYPLSNLTVHVLAAPRVPGSKILTWGLELKAKPDPYVKTILKELSRPKLKDQRSDAERLKLAMKSSSIDLHLLRNLPRILRQNEWKISATLYDGEIIDINKKGDKGAFGVAVDVGTTTIVIYLIDLTSGKVLTIESDYNAQIPYGEDVISRLTHISKEKDGLATLQSLVIGTINKLLKSASERAGIEKGRIYEVVCSGNTIMMSILLGIDPSFIATAPYVPPDTSSIVVKARELGIDINPRGYLRTVPSISGYVGADVVSDVLVSGMHMRDEISLLIDIGTNGEVVIGNRHKMLSASCAAGPALEGAEITFGMRGIAGAIERVFINPESYEVFYQTIGGGRPRGICGSGLVDALASLTIAGLVDSTGKMTIKHQQNQGKPQEFVLVKADETEIEKDITITQRDVRNLQLAKAAIFTGCSLLMKKMHIKPKDLRNVYVAGAFGNYIDPLSAIVIGMFPDVPIERIRSIGNGAGFGARLVLLSKRKSIEAKSIASKMRYIELSGESDFQKEFLKALNLPHTDRSLFPTATRIIDSKGKEHLWSKYSFASKHNRS
ncbi:MAG: ASKHA domain-containing protein [Thermoproteota archaeon]